MTAQQELEYEQDQLELMVREFIADSKNENDFASLVKEYAKGFESQLNTLNYAHYKVNKLY